MSGGELMAAQAVMSIGSKLLGGGGAQAAPGGAPAPGPFDAIAGGQPPAAPPPPPAKPSLFAGGAQLTPDKAPPLPTKNPLFHSPPGGAGGAPGMAMPTKNPLFHDQAGGAAEAARGLLAPRPQNDVMAELQDKPLRGGQDMPKPQMAAPIDNNQSARDQGWDVETIYGTELQSGSQGAPYGDMADVPKSRAGVTDAAKPPSPAKLAAPEMDPEAPVQAFTPQGMPKPEMQQGFDTSPPSAPGKSGAKPKQGGLFGITIPGVGEVNEKLRKSSTNPLFQVGMGLMSSGYDGSNPFTQMNAGMGRIPGLEIAASQEGRAQTKAERDEAERLERLQQEQIMMAILGKDPGSANDDEDERGGRVAKQAAKVVR